MIQLAMSMRAVAVVGNHDYMVIKACEDRLRREAEEGESKGPRRDISAGVTGAGAGEKREDEIEGKDGTESVRTESERTESERTERPVVAGMVISEEHRRIAESLNEEEMDYLMKMPYIHRLDEYGVCVVHAGGNTSNTSNTSHHWGV